MTTHPTADREQWLAARLRLLEAEKELTRRSDAVARQRQELPWVPVTKDYRFDTETGPATLAELFGGRSQLLVYHFMFGPEYSAGCPSCSAIADGFDGFAVHLEHHDVALVAVSRAPLQALQDYRRRMGWSVRWVSSNDSEFSFDFNTSFSVEQQRSGAVDYNFREVDTTWLRGADERRGVSTQAAMSGTDTATYIREQPGMSAFVLQRGVVHHTYSTYSRGLDGLWGMYQWLDRAPKGRNDNEVWWRRHDEYEPTRVAP